MRPSRFAQSSLVIAALLLLLSDVAGACKVVPHRPADYLERHVPEAVVFLGTVTRVQDTQAAASSGVRTQNIEFRVTQWWTGTRPKKVVVRGTIGSMKGTDCEGTFDFSAQPREEWLIFGQHHQGRIVADNFVSLRLNNGAIPLEVKKELDRFSPQPSQGNAGPASAR